MIIRDLLSRVFPDSRSLENPSTELYEALTQGGAPGTDSGIAVNEEQAMRVIAVLAAVRLIAQTCASLPIKVYTRQNDSRVELRRPNEKYLWGRPNPEQTAQFFWETLFGHALLYGNAFILKNRDGFGRVTEIWPLAPWRVKVGRDKKTGKKVYEVNRKAYTDYEITHIPAFSMDGFLGLNPIAQARQSIGLSLAAEKFGAKFFGSGSQLSGIISVPGELDDDDATRLLRQWNRAHRGIDNAHEAAILDSNASWHTVGIPPEDAQFLETRKFQVAEIARLFSVPPHLIGDVEKSTSWGSGLEEQNIMFVTLTLLPWLRRFEQAITDDLTQATDHYAKFSLDALLRGDTKTRMEAYQIGRFMGIWSVNEVRKMEDEDPLDIDGADDHHIQLAMTTIDKLHNAVTKEQNIPAAPDSETDPDPTPDESPEDEETP